MSEINPLGVSNYYAGIQNATSKAAQDAKSEKIKEQKKLSFAERLHGKTDQEYQMEAAGFPPEIANMSIEDAAVYLADKVNISGDAYSSSPTMENMHAFKKTVQQFVNFVIDKNYDLNVARKRRPKMISSPSLLAFSPFEMPPHPQDPKVQIQIINRKLDELSRATLFNQRNSLELLAKVNEIKGLIVDFMQS